MTRKELIDKLKKEDIIPFLDDYYKSVGRTMTPNYREYSLAELKKCLILFNIELVKDNVVI